MALDFIRDLYFRLNPPPDLNRLAGLMGYTLQALTTNQKAKMAVSVGGKPYNAMALEAFNQYDLCAVVGVEDAFLKIRKSFKTRAEIIDLITEITNIKNIESIDLIDNITKIGTIGEIATIKDLRQPNLIINNDFETGDLTGWFIGNPDSGTVNVSSLNARHGIYSCRFICLDPIGGATIEIEQIQMGLRSDWLTELMCWWYCSTTGTKFWIGVEYDDGTVDDFFDTQAVIPFWRPMVADTFTAGKRVYKILFSPAVDAVNNGKTFFLDLPTWVF